MEKIDAKTVKAGILSGLCLSIGAISYLKAGAIVGAVLFAFGLATIVCFRWQLFTGMAGFTQKGGYPKLFAVLVLNAAGCWLGAILSGSIDVLAPASAAIVKARCAAGPLNCFMLSILCGFIMTASVKFARKGNWLPLVLGIPAFIISGLPHCVADTFYLSACGLECLSENISMLLIVYPMEVLGNFVGCNLWRIGPSLEEPVAEN